MTANPFAALLRDVPRYDGYGTFDPDGDVVRLSEVLAALAAAVPADLAEAGKVLEGVTPGPWAVGDGYVDWHHSGEHAAAPDAIVAQDGKCVVGSSEWTILDPTNARFIAWCREGVPALIARLAAQEVQIKGLKAERNEAINQLDSANHSIDVLEKRVAHFMERAEAAETALAATDAAQAREAHLREAAAAVRARYMGDNNREDQEVLRCEAAILDLIGERT